MAVSHGEFDVSGRTVAVRLTMFKDIYLVNICEETSYSRRVPSLLLRLGPPQRHLQGLSDVTAL
jgi:hypothetical protein